MLYLSLLFLSTAFILFAVFNKQISKVLQRKVCALCFAVSSTWIFLLLIRYFGNKVDPTLIAILMGQSIIGVSFEIKKRFENSEFLWLARVGIVVVGTFAIYSFLTFSDILSLILLIFIILIGFYSLPQYESKVKKEGKEQRRAKRSAIEMLQERLKDCC